MPELLCTRVTAVWALLVAATLLSWWLGSGNGIDSHLTASAVVICVATVKVRLIGLYFMEIRDAPRPLRVVFELYCILLLGVLLGTFLLA